MENELRRWLEIGAKKTGEIAMVHSCYDVESVINALTFDIVTVPDASNTVALLQNERSSALSS